MNIHTSGLDNAYALADSDQTQSFFASSYRCISATGVFERITQAVDAKESGDGDFQQTIEAAFMRAKSKGIANPILIGAIPFDLSKPSSLVIPQSHEFFSRSLLVDDKALPETENIKTPKVLSSRSLPNEARFKQSVQQAIANFQLSDIRKAVLSRILEVELADKVEVTPIFARLMAQNPSAFHFRLPMTDGSELIGASPELLVRKEGDRIFSNPLAGSAKRQADPERDRQISESLLQSGKDAYEHHLVIEDIRAVLTPLCKELTIPDAPSLLGTQAMWHLSTGIEGVLSNSAMNVLQVACKLHPTPAVCGFPTNLAHKLIKLVEPFERDMFTGMVGWCDAQGNGEWVVTIRCGRIHHNRIQLFAGAGIVEDSCPESEFAETQAKLQTMLNALGVELPGVELPAVELARAETAKPVAENAA